MWLVMCIVIMTKVVILTSNLEIYVFYLYLGNIHHICLMQHIPISGLHAERRKGKGSHSLLVIVTIPYYHSR